MAKPKFDGVVEAVRYTSDGQVDWVRAYLRRGPTFSDHQLLSRQTLIEDLKEGKKYLAGSRVPRMASTFKVSEPLRLLDRNGSEVLVTGELQADQDNLEGVPII
jgi:hypothetical protein